MKEAFIELSKYILCIVMILYTIQSYYIFRFRDPDRKKIVYINQNILMLLLHCMGFVLLYFGTNDLFFLFFYAFQQILFFAAIVIFRVIYPRINRLLLNNLFFLLSIGLIMIARISQGKAIRQFQIIVLSLVLGAMAIIVIKKMELLKKLTWGYGITGFALLFIVLILGVATNGAKISYSLFGYTFQPSEFVKLLFVFFLAGMLCAEADFMRVFTTGIVAFVYIIVLIASKDLGSALILYVVFLMLVYIATEKVWYLLAGGVAGLAGAALAYRIFYHVQVRYDVWVNPWKDISGTGYQIGQSLFAIGTGGWFGRGIYQGKPGAIPFVEADFIFSAISEEFGVIFSICLVLVCVSSFIMCMKLALKIKDRFYMLVVSGLGIIYLFQVFLTIGGGIKFIPLTGVTLPLVSYGGSSVLTTILLFSIIQGAYLLSRQDDPEDDEDWEDEENDEYEDEYDEMEDYESEDYDANHVENKYRNNKYRSNHYEEDLEDDWDDDLVMEDLAYGKEGEKSVAKKAKRIRR